MVHRRIRVIDLETAGSAPHQVCEIGWQDVIETAEGRWSLGEEHGARFVHPGGPIPPALMAIHHIIDADVESAPFWRQVAPEVLAPPQGVLALAAHRADFEQRYCSPMLSAGADWICTWKCALRIWPEMSSFSNQGLRYARAPVGLDRARGLPAHRAAPDAYVTAHHLRDQLNAASLEDLLAWSRQPGLLPRVPSGPSRGRSWSELDAASLKLFSQDRDASVRFSAQGELQRRGEPTLPIARPDPQPRLL